MPKLNLLLPLLALSALGAAAVSRADVVETKDGSHFVGKITKIDSGAVYLTTDAAGDLVIKQSSVTAIGTDSLLALRLESGTRMDGKVAMTQNGNLQITGNDGVVTTSIDKVAAGWATNGTDPEIVALERHWKYEASVDINGTTGNKDQLGTEGSFSAKLITAQDELDFYTDYNRQVASGVKSADQFKAGVDYTSHFDPRVSWYVKDESGFDRIMDVRLYDTAAAGLGYDLIKNKEDLLTVRGGLGYRYDDYYNPLTPTVNSAAADFEVLHDLKLANWELNNDLTIVPAFNDLRNVIATQDSFFQVPLADPAWKLRMGLSNEYNGEPGAGIKKLDTTYYTRLILDWGGAPGAGK
jgi:putative salt-induced outer membrane protein YdiY